MKLSNMFAPVADIIRAVDNQYTSGPKIYIGKTSLGYVPITTLDNVRTVRDAFSEYKASGIERAFDSYVENSSRSLGSVLLDDIPADVKESIEKNESKIDLPIKKYSVESAHWCAMISKNDDEVVSIFTLGGADLPLGRPLEIKEVRKEDPGFDDEYNRYTWHFVGGCKARSLRAGLDMMRWKARMINERGIVYDLEYYNCQTTTMEIALAGSWNPTYAAKRISCMWIGS